MGSGRAGSDPNFEVRAASLGSDPMNCEVEARPLHCLNACPVGK